MKKTGSVIASPEIEKILDKYRPKGVKVDLGCGNKKVPGFLGIDRQDLPGVDIIQELEEYPWVLPDECADMVVASHLLEHINPANGGFLRFMDEIWRILRPGGTLLIVTPYAGSIGYWADPTHINGITENTWLYFDPLEANGQGGFYRLYCPKPWKIVSSTWSMEGNLEAALEKRAEDPSYVIG